MDHETDTKKISPISSLLIQGYLPYGAIPIYDTDPSRFIYYYDKSKEIQHLQEKAHRFTCPLPFSLDAEKKFQDFDNIIIKLFLKASSSSGNSMQVIDSPSKLHRANVQLEIHDIPLRGYITNPNVSFDTPHEIFHTNLLPYSPGSANLIMAVTSPEFLGVIITSPDSAGLFIHNSAGILPILILE